MQTGLLQFSVVSSKPAVALAKAVHDPSLVPFSKSDTELQIVWGEVYAPGFPDSQGDFMDAAAIRDMAYSFMERQALTKIDIGHSQVDCGAYVVESFIARDDDPTFIPGSWVIGVKVPDATQWSLIKSGELNGFSLDGFGIRVPTELVFEMPDLLKGETDAFDGHHHEFEVSYSADGTFLGGRTTPAEDGHWHVIKQGTCTENAGTKPHSHRFSFVEGILECV